MRYFCTLRDNSSEFYNKIFPHSFFEFVRVVLIYCTYCTLPTDYLLLLGIPNSTSHFPYTPHLYCVTLISQCRHTELKVFLPKALKQINIKYFSIYWTSATTKLQSPWLKCDTFTSSGEIGTPYCRVVETKPTKKI